MTVDNERVNEQTSAAEKNPETTEKTKLPKQAFDSELRSKSY